MSDAVYPALLVGGAVLCWYGVIGYRGIQTTQELDAEGLRLGLEPIGRPRGILGILDKPWIWIGCSLLGAGIVICTGIVYLYNFFN